MTEVINGVPRSLLEQVAIELEHDTDRYMLGRELRKLLAEQPQAGVGKELSVAPDGYVIVPVEPTHEMAMAAKRELYKSPAWHCRYTAAVRAAISAAPQPPARRGQGDEVGNLREAVAMIRYARGATGFENEMPHVVSCNDLPDGLYPVYLATAQPVSDGEYGDAYQGARQDLAIWKRRALEAESKIREQDQIIENLGNALNDENGPTFMGEPVLRPVSDGGEWDVAAFEVEIPDIAATFDGLYLTPMMPLKSGEHLMTVAQHLRIEKQLRAAISPAEQPGLSVPDALREAVEYLDSNPFNEIGAGSILHRAMRDAIAAAPSPSDKAKGE